METTLKIKLVIWATKGSVTMEQPAGVKRELIASHGAGLSEMATIGTVQFPVYRQGEAFAAVSGADTER